MIAGETTILQPTEPGWYMTLPIATYRQAEFLIDELTDQCETSGPTPTPSGYVVSYRPRKNVANVLREVLTRKVEDKPVLIDLQQSLEFEEVADCGRIL
jgi:hypothetical protein